MQRLSCRIHATWRATCALSVQALLWLDQGLNCIGLGMKAVLLAAVTGEQQATVWADETLSAHAWRAEHAGKPWGRLLRPVIDAAFFWQPSDPLVNAAVGRVVIGHCERAFHKKRLHLGLAREYRD